jgi:arginine exporter protein ArgO
MIRVSAPRSPFGTGMMIAFIVAQLCDGVLTYVGVRTFGLAIEANPIISWYIETLGVATALMGAKGLAIACATLLYQLAHYRTICALTVMYFTVAIHPWVILLMLSD